ncbi:MAG: YitT family protein [Faecousia sp.]
MKAGKKALTYFVIIFMAFLSALNYELFVFPNEFAPAGLNGICTMIQYLTGVRVSLLNLLLNIPLAVLVYRLVSRPLALRSLVYTLAFSLALALFDRFPLERFAYATENGTSTILGPLVGGIIGGFCYSVVLRAGSYTGGTDFVAALIRVRHPETNFIMLTFGLNAAVAILSYFVYGYQIEPVLLCILFCYLSSSVSNSILKSGKSAIKFEIVTQHPEELSGELIHTLHHSVTLLKGTGMYSGKSVSVLMCIINRNQILELEEVISHYPGTFAYLSSVREVVGNFKHINKKGLQEASLLDDGSDGTV